MAWGGCEGGEGHRETLQAGLSREATSYPRERSELLQPEHTWKTPEQSEPDQRSQPKSHLLKDDLTSKDQDGSRKNDVILVQKLGEHCMLQPFRKGPKALWKTHLAQLPTLTLETTERETQRNPFKYQGSWPRRSQVCVSMDWRALKTPAVYKL